MCHLGISCFVSLENCKLLDMITAIVAHGKHTYHNSLWAVTSVKRVFLALLLLPCALLLTTMKWASFSFMLFCCDVSALKWANQRLNLLKLEAKIIFSFLFIFRCPPQAHALIGRAFGRWLIHGDTLAKCSIRRLVWVQKARHDLEGLFSTLAGFFTLSASWTSQNKQLSSAQALTPCCGPCMDWNF